MEVGAKEMFKKLMKSRLKWVVIWREWEVGW